MLILVPGKNVDDIRREKDIAELLLTKRRFIQMSILVVVCITANAILKAYEHDALSTLAILIMPFYTIRLALSMQPKDNRVKLTFRRLVKSAANPKYYTRLVLINAKHRMLREYFYNCQHPSLTSVK
tara:strand:- start:1234 stop:1614 length:381 start_codon:yes stop_codon:yes gene_type:complete